MGPPLKHDPKKWVSVLRKDHAQTMSYSAIATIAASCDIEAVRPPSPPRFANFVGMNETIF
jgi:hypothetical protein